MADMVLGRLAAAGKEGAVTHLHFEDAGHSFMPWAPSGPALVGRALNALRLRGFGGMFDLGGRPKANRAALGEAWSKAVGFLRKNLPADR